MFRALKRAGCSQLTAVTNLAESMSRSRLQSAGCGLEQHSTHVLIRVNSCLCVCPHASARPVVDPLTFIQCTACDAHMNGALFHDANGHTAVSAQHSREA